MKIIITKKEIGAYTNMLSKLKTIDPNLSNINEEINSLFETPEKTFQNGPTLIFLSKEDKVVIDIHEEFNVETLNLYEDLIVESLPLLLLAKGMIKRFERKFIDHCKKWEKAFSYDENE